MPPQVLTTRKAASKTRQELRALVRYVAKENLFTFAREILGYREMTRAFHGPVCARLQDPAGLPHALYLLPRDHFKTSVITIARAVQRVLQHPEDTGLIASNKAENAEAMLAEIKGHLQNPLLLDAFPDVLFPDPARQAETWTRSTITVRRKRRQKEGTIETIGVEGEATSKHYDWGVFDDLVGFENSQTKEQLRRTIQWRRTAASLFKPTSRTDDVGTPWAYGDLAGWWIEQHLKGTVRLGVYRQPCWATTHPGVLRVDGRGGVVDEYVRDAAGELVPAFPERFSREALLERKRLVGGPTFAAQYLLNPVDDETAVFPRSRAVIRPASERPDPATLWCVMAVDPAISIKEWADYTALAVAGFDADGRMHVLDLRRGQWPESKTVESVYHVFGRTPGIRAIGFEAVGFAKIFRREFTRAGEQRGVYLPVIGLERDTKVTKNTRIRALQPLWEHGEIVFYDDLDALDDLLDEAERFRLYRESVHDDLLDALADCLQLRVRPMRGEGQDRRSVLLDDPDLLARQEFEDRLLADRAARGLPPLDYTSMRAAWGMRRRREAMDEERGMLGGAGSATGEFWT